jgi:hypothetical protein
VGPRWVSREALNPSCGSCGPLRRQPDETVSTKYDYHDNIYVNWFPKRTSQ